MCAMTSNPLCPGLFLMWIFFPQLDGEEDEPEEHGEREFGEYVETTAPY